MNRKIFKKIYFNQNKNYVCKEIAETFVVVRLRKGEIKVKGRLGKVTKRILSWHMHVIVKLRQRER